MLEQDAGELRVQLLPGERIEIAVREHQHRRPILAVMIRSRLHAPLHVLMALGETRLRASLPLELIAKNHELFVQPKLPLQLTERDAPRPVEELRQSPWLDQTERTQPRNTDSSRQIGRLELRPALHLPGLGQRLSVSSWRHAQELLRQFLLRPESEVARRGNIFQMEQHAQREHMDRRRKSADFLESLDNGSGV